MATQTVSKISAGQSSFAQDRLVVELAKNEDAEAIAEMFEAALGKNGIHATGHDPYPDPALFSKSGVESIIAAYPERKLVIAKIDNTIAGGMIIDALSPFHCEFNCMAVRNDLRGNRIGSRIVSGAKKVVEDSLFTLNCTELVTHSLMSQSAHFNEGYNSICGFGYCHYPNVFFADHPESVLWVTLPQGRLVESLKELRKQLGRGIISSTPEIARKIRALAPELIGKGLICEELNSDEDALLLAAEILKTRTIFLPAEYLPLAESILIQFRDILHYELKEDTSGSSVAQGSGKLNVNYVDGYAHSYLTYTPDFKFDSKELDQAVESVKKLGKRFMLVRIPANSPAAPEVISHLKQLDFMFHSLLPLYGFQKSSTDKPELHDVITMQWVAPHIIESNPLPGETNSVIKLHGYPDNLSGSVLRQIRHELRAQPSNK